MAKLVLWLAVIAVVLLSFEVAARGLAESTQHTSEADNKFEDAKYGGGYYPPRGGYYPPRGGYYPPRGGYYPPRGGYYPPHHGGGGYCYHGRCYGRCCSSAAEAAAVAQALATTQTQN